MEQPRFFPVKANEFARLVSQLMNRFNEEARNVLPLLDMNQMKAKEFRTLSPTNRTLLKFWFSGEYSPITPDEMKVLFERNFEDYDSLRYLLDIALASKLERLAQYVPPDQGNRSGSIVNGASSEPLGLLKLAYTYIIGKYVEEQLVYCQGFPRTMHIESVYDAFFYYNPMWTPELNYKNLGWLDFGVTYDEMPNTVALFPLNEVPTPNVLFQILQAMQALSEIHVTIVKFGFYTCVQMVRRNPDKGDYVYRFGRDGTSVLVFLNQETHNDLLVRLRCYERMKSDEKSTPIDLFRGMAQQALDAMPSVPNDLAAAFSNEATEEQTLRWYESAYFSKVLRIEEGFLDFIPDESDQSDDILCGYMLEEGEAPPKLNPYVSVGTKEYYDYEL